MSGLEFYEKFKGTDYNQPVNRVVLFVPNPDSTERIQYYDKINLAPGWEGIPYLSWFHKAGIRFGNEYKFHKKGDRIRLFDIPGQRRHFTVGAPICFEQNAPWLWNRMVKLGAEGFIQVSFESWFGNLFQKQVAYITRLRRSDPARGGPVPNGGLTFFVDIFGGSIPCAGRGIVDNRFHRAFKDPDVLYETSKSFPRFLPGNLHRVWRVPDTDWRKKTFAEY
jgi:hypothetical protein